MDVERTIEFLMDHQAQAEVRMERLERAVSQTNRSLNQLVRYGVSLRGDVRRHDEAINPTGQGHGPPGRGSRRDRREAQRPDRLGGQDHSQERKMNN